MKDVKLIQLTLWQMQSFLQTCANVLIRTLL